MSHASWVPPTIAWLGLALIGVPALVIVLSRLLLRRAVTDEAFSPAATRAWLITMIAAVTISIAGHLVARAHVPWTLTRTMEVGAKAQDAEEEERVRHRTVAVTLAAGGLLAVAFGWIPVIRNPGRPSPATRPRLAATSVVCAVSLGIYAVVYWPPLVQSFERDPSAAVSYRVSNGHLSPRPTGKGAVPAAILHIPRGMPLVDFIDGPFRDFVVGDAMDGCIISLASEESKLEVRFELASERDLGVMERPNDPTPIPMGRHALIRLHESGVMDISLNTTPLKARSRFQAATVEIRAGITFGTLVMAIQKLQADGYLRFGFSVRR